MASAQDEAREALLKEITSSAPDSSPETLKVLAEAYAWVISPAQPH